MDKERRYTEAEVNKRLGEQKTDIRLDSIEFSIKKIDDMMEHHMNDERKDTMNIMNAIEQSIKECLECETKLRSELQAVNLDHYERFVKKADLKSYAFLILFAVTATTSFITWLGYQSTENLNNSSVDEWP